MRTCWYAPKAGPVLSLGLACALMVCGETAPGVQPFGDDGPPDSYALETSLWDSNYTVQGNNVRAVIRFQGRNGRYDLIGQNNQIFDTGRLREVSYVRGDDGAYHIVGTWDLGGVTGDFDFPIRPGRTREFLGRWTRGGVGEGPWNGRRLFAVDPDNPPLEPGFANAPPPDENI